MLAREIRTIGYDPADLGAGVISATENQLFFSRAREDDDQELEYIRYQLYTAHSGTPRARSALGRAANDDPASLTNRAVAEYIEQLEFSYIMADGNRQLNPNADDLAEIRGVEISLLARAANEDQRYRDNREYETAAGTIWGPYDDGFRRRILQKTVICRNLGLAP